MFLQPDGTFFVQLINFAIFFALLNVVFIRPVGRAIRQRRDYINSVTNDYDRYQAEAASCRSEAEAIRAAARREAGEMLSKIRAQVSNESAEMAAGFNRQASEIADDAHRAVAVELENARTRLSSDAAELAGMIVARTVTELAR